jgi:hypothetical protein
MHGWIKNANEISQQFKTFFVFFAIILDYSYKFGKMLKVISFFSVILGILKDKIEKVVFQRKFE